MARPKGSKNKPKTGAPTEVAVKRPRGRPRKIDQLIAAKPKVARTKPTEEKVLPNVDFEDNDREDGPKIIQCPYMGPDADDSEQFIRQQVVGDRKWNEEDFGGSFSINIDSLY